MVVFVVVLVSFRFWVLMWVSILLVLIVLFRFMVWLSSLLLMWKDSCDLICGFILFVYLWLVVVELVLMIWVCIVCLGLGVVVCLLYFEMSVDSRVVSNRGDVRCRRWGM